MTNVKLIKNPIWTLVIQSGGSVLFEGRATQPLSPPSDGITLAFDGKTYRVDSTETSIAPDYNSTVGDYVTSISVMVTPT